MTYSILQKFLIPLPESYSPRIDVISKDDLNFLEAIGNYMYQKRSNSNEALNTLSGSLALAERRSDLYKEISKASQDRLSETDSIYVRLDLSNFNESDIGDHLLDQPCSYMTPLISGSIDGTFTESHNGNGGYSLYPFESENTKVFVPVLEKWLKEYRSKHNHSLAINEFLSSVSDSFRLNEEQKEVISRHNSETLGRITSVG
jgi:hypothetical protein